MKLNDKPLSLLIQNDVITNNLSSNTLHRNTQNAKHVRNYTLMNNSRQTNHSTGFPCGHYTIDITNFLTLLVFVAVGLSLVNFDRNRPRYILPFRIQQSSQKQKKLDTTKGFDNRTYESIKCTISKEE